MTDHSVIDRVLAANRYFVLGTADQAGTPWVTPVFFAPLGPDRVCWVSSPDSRHSRNIAERAAIAIAVFDSTVEVGQAEAAYFDADAAQATPEESETPLQALNARLPPDKVLSVEDLRPHGPMVIYRANLLPPLRPRPRRQPRPRKCHRHDARGLTISAETPGTPVRLDARA